MRAVLESVSEMARLGANHCVCWDLSDTDARAAVVRVRSRRPTLNFFTAMIPIPSIRYILQSWTFESPIDRIVCLIAFRAQRISHWKVGWSFRVNSIKDTCD